MNVKPRLKNVGMWVSLVGFLYLFLGFVGLDLVEGQSGAVIDTFAYILTLLGIINDPTSGRYYCDKKTST